MDLVKKETPTVNVEIKESTKELEKSFAEEKKVRENEDRILQENIKEMKEK